MDYEKKYKDALEKARKIYDDIVNNEVIGFPGQITDIFPELTESEDERIRKRIYGLIYHNDALLDKDELLAWLEKLKERDLDIVPELRPTAWAEGYQHGRKDTEEKYSGMMVCSPEEWNEAISDAFKHGMDEGEKQKEQKPIKMEVYEVGKGTTVCGQDYKCKKNYMTGTCRYIKDAIYHCSRDGYLNDQNGISWSCSPEWFKEYIQSNAEWAEEEKTRFVSGQFLQCKLSFDEFKEGEHYWLEYVGDDMYVGRSDNILNQKFHITPRQLYTLFSQQLEEKQKEQKMIEN